MTMGGYIGEPADWASFELRWDAVLRAFEVPYLHMKEFGAPDNSIYGHIKADREKELDFMAALVDAIRHGPRASIAATVILSDLDAFNQKNGLRLDPYSMGIYACLLQMRSYFPGQEIDVVVDKFEAAPSRIAKALSYLETHNEPTGRDLFNTTSLGADELWRTIFPLQAADLIAWEVRKYRTERTSFRPSSLDVRRDRNAMHSEFLVWEDANKPRDRGSFQNLRYATVAHPHHAVVDELALIEVSALHPTGWGA